MTFGVPNSPPRFRWKISRRWDRIRILSLELKHFRAVSFCRGAILANSNSESHTECTKIAHRHSLAIFHNRLGSVGISFARLNRREIAIR